MTRRVIVAVTYAMLCALSYPLSAQDETGSANMYDRPINAEEEALVEQLKRSINLNWQFGASFLVINPQDSLRRAIESLGMPGTGFGFAFDAAYYLDPLPFAFGADFGVAFYGGSTRTFYRPVGPFIDTLTYQAQNTHVPIQLFLRLQPNVYTWVYPFAEVVGGLTITGSTLDINRSNGFAQSSETQSSGSSTWQYGVGCGVMVKLVDFVTLPTMLQRMLFHVKARYLWGDNTSVTSYQINENQTTPVIQQSVPFTENVHVAVGFTGLF